MSNHYHMILTVPSKKALKPLTEVEWLERVSAIYDVDKINDIQRQLNLARDNAKTPKQAERMVSAILQQFEDRRAVLDVFMKELNQRISIYINDRFERRGTLWEAPYGSTHIEGNEGHLMAAAAYVDLNPVRAGLVKRPEDYRLCGYAEAVAGVNRGKARKQLGAMLSEALIDEDFRSDWRRTHRRYRLMLYGEGNAVAADPEKGIRAKAGFSQEQVEKVEQADGEMSVPELLRHRVRYYTAGAAIGSREYIEKLFLNNRHRFGASRKTGARKMRGGNWGDRYSLRDLKRNVIGPGP